ncbi:MAG TPA: hypothetical protein VK395_29520 [Gemmataceae bacterium]|nr:hypothetical protein [Gemmataceae bacterium]
MTDSSKQDRLRKALDVSGSAWLLEYWGDDAESRLAQAVVDLDDFACEYERRFSERPDPFELLESDPIRGKAFFQIDTFVISLEMKIMIWRIMLGCEILRVEFRYDMEDATDLLITLRTPYGAEEQYRGKRSRDFRVLRHFGATEDNERLILQGYYALK